MTDSCLISLPGHDPTSDTCDGWLFTHFLRGCWRQSEHGRRSETLASNVLHPTNDATTFLMFMVGPIRGFWGSNGWKSGRTTVFEDESSTSQKSLGCAANKQIRQASNIERTES